MPRVSRGILQPDQTVLLTSAIGPATAMATGAKQPGHSTRLSFVIETRSSGRQLHEVVRTMKRDVTNRVATFWKNPHFHAPDRDARDAGITFLAIEERWRAWQQVAPLVSHIFPETSNTD